MVKFATGLVEFWSASLFDFDSLIEVDVISVFNSLISNELNFDFNGLLDWHGLCISDLQKQQSNRRIKMSVTATLHPNANWIDQWINHALNAKPVHTLNGVDIIHTEAGVELDFELAGIAKEDVEISVENSVLKVRAEKKNPRQSDTEWRLRERRFGTYERAFRLSDNLDADQVAATMENGVLTVKIARKEESLPKKIVVQ